MTKKQLIDALADETGLKRSVCLDAVEGMMNVLCDTFAAGDSIYLRGLGTFRVRRVKQRVARDINRRKAVIVPPRLRVKFIPSNDLRKRLNGDE